MRKIIQLYLSCNFIFWIITLFIYIGYHTPFSLSVCVISACLMAVFNIVLAIAMSVLGLDKDWFKTQQMLQNELEQNVEVNRQLRELMGQFGQHEVIKMWEEAKNKTHDTSL